LGLSRVAVQTAGGRSDLSVGEFLALPLDQRVRMVLEKQLEFFDEAGCPLPIGDGLKLLRAVRDMEPVSTR
jgi:hypothetical protein